MIDALLTIWHYRAIFQMVLFACLILIATRSGAGPERAAAVIIGQMPVSDALYHAVVVVPPTFNGVEVGHLAIDLVTTAGLVFIALQANRMYTLWMGSLQILALQAHLTREMLSLISPIAYATMQILPSYLQIVALACGIWCHYRRSRTFGTYRQWRSSSFLSLRTERRAWQLT